MHSLLLKKSLYVGSYILTALLIEFITFNSMGIGVFPTYFWLDVAILCFVAAVIFIVPSFRAQTVMICLMLVLQVLLSIINHSLYGMSNMVFNLSMLNLLNEVGGVFTNEFLDYLFIVGLIFIFIAECFVLVRLKKLKARQSFRLQTIVMLVLIFCLSSGVSSNLYYIALDSFATVSPSDELYIYKDDSYLYDTQFISAKAFKKFGTFGFYYKNIANFVKVDPSMTEEEKEADLRENLETLDGYFADGTWSGTLSPYEGCDQIMTGKFEGQNVVLVVVESGEWYAINREYTPTLYALASQGIAMTEYYARDKTNHSEAMSVLGSYPAKTENSIAPTLTDPNGLLDHNFAFALPNILQDGGYTTNYFHANVGSYYAREDTFAEPYGFDNAYFLDTMNRLSGYYSKNGFYDLDRDSEMISQYLEEMEMRQAGDDAFFTMMMTITSHGHYNDLIENGDYTADLTPEEKAALADDYVTKNLEPYYERIDGFPETYVDDKFAVAAEEDLSGDVYLRYKRYQAGMMDLDVGINRLIADLSQKGELDNTTFVFYADHNSYYTQQSYFMKGIPTTEYWNTAHYNIPFFIWSGSCMDLSVDGALYDGMTYSNADANVTSAYSGEYYYSLNHSAAQENIGGIKIEKYCNSFDILPTVLDLLGYEYNTALYQGVNVFKDEQSVFVSRESGMFSDYIYSDGDRVFVHASSADGTAVSDDGETRIGGGTVTIRVGGQDISYAESDVRIYIYLSDEGDHIVFDLDAIFRAAEREEETPEYLPDGVNSFLKKTSAYYEKQEYLESMYAYDYFRYRDISDLIRKVSAV